MDEDKIQALLLYFEYLKEVANIDDDEETIQKFKIKLDQLNNYKDIFLRFFETIYLRRREILMKQDLKSQMLVKKIIEISESSFQLTELG